MEILGLEVTLDLVQFQINAVESSSSISPILNNLTPTVVDAAPTWKSCLWKLLLALVMEALSLMTVFATKTIYP